MSFLSGIFLLALPLAAVPVVLHLYRRRQRAVIPWGAMQFLTDAINQGRRRERWEELLLMILRAAAVLALVFAFSRPQLSGEWFGEHPTREVILVLDDSMSMAREVSGETAFDDLIRKAEGVLDQLNSDDVVQVMTAVGGPQWMTSESMRATGTARASLLRQITALAPTDGAADLYSCVQAALAVEPADDARGRHIVVLTDGAAHGWRVDSLSAWRRLQDLVDASDMPTTLQAISCGAVDEPTDNVAVIGMEASHTQVGVREEVTLRVDVKNVGDTALGSTKMQTAVNGEPLDELDVDAIASGETTSVQWKWQADNAGVYALSCRLPAEDQLLADNEDSVIVEVVSEIPVLIVEAPAEYRQRLAEASFVTTALGYEGETPRDGWHSVFAPHLISVEDLKTTPLGEYRAIVITDAAPIVSESAERLREFVERGGGLWVALGRRTDREAFNAVWYDDGGGLCPLPLDDVVTYTSDGEQQAVIHPPSRDHFTTAQLADTNRLDIDTVRIKARHRFQPPAPGQELSTILETGDGDPLVIENYLGRGRVIFQSLPFDVGWSNLPITRAFVVMVQDWFDYLTQPAATQYNLAAGGRIEVSRPPSSARNEATLSLPDGSTKSLPLRESGDGFVYRYSQTHVPGRYEVHMVDGEERTSLPFQVVRDAKESELTLLTDEQREALSQSAGLEFGDALESVIPEATGNRREKPIWNTLLAAVIILLVGELILATRAARRRTPSSTLAPTLEMGGELFSQPSAEPVTGNH